MRVLIVEDDPDLAICLGMAMDHFGHEFAHASSVQSAIALLNERQDFDAAVLDLEVASEWTHQVAERLQELNIHFFFASAWGSDKLPAGVDKSRHLRKPFLLAQLEASLASCRARS